MVGSCRSNRLRRAAMAVLAAGLLTGVLAATAPSRAQAPAQVPAQAPQAQPPQVPAATPPELAPESIAALRRMGKHLVSLRSFEIVATLSIEYVLDNDQKILLGGTSQYRVRRPDRLRIDLST